jgi:hypothetical protein
MIGAIGCQSDEPSLPSVQVQGRFLSYAANDDIVVCGGTVSYAEAWMEALALYLGIDPDQMLPTTYSFVDSSLLEEVCGSKWGGCTHREGGHIQIFATRPFLYHELVHAVKASAWPRRQPLLQEGLASAFDQDVPVLYYEFTPDEIDTAIEAERGIHLAYSVGNYLVYWMLTLYGSDAFKQFWYASSRPTTAADFRATFEGIFGESLDEMLAGLPSNHVCPISICAGEPLAWEQGRWTTESPHSCADGAVVGYIGEDYSDLIRNELMEITEAGSYDVSVSESTNTGQGATIMPCQDGCVQLLIAEGESYTMDFAPGLYRVTTVASHLDEPGIRVEIRPSN